ncbi:cobalt-precorrin-5B (C(1))-methyltransferase CbiD [Desulfopila sp. IMCC35008]|uniref:cobalt-precorrin-5B (C(1))-methyltransferase CbiD n=1 Tax=Desulfopila sp. IMCC35008 TaxID=2653858 RepID=UPI0013D268DE|nr:cobalt-precorrin-5B (C(1))-methyltransferase CbiD [Desulfopila sp. IMCC35008]
MKKKKLRSGFTTGACAAASAKAAASLLIGSQSTTIVEIPFPDGQRVSFELFRCSMEETEKDMAYASIIKDAGDDPDVTNKAEIGAKVRLLPLLTKGDNRVVITGGQGVGTVTKAGLAVEIGQSAINPVPLKMIREAVLEVWEASSKKNCFAVEIVVPAGMELAKKTLNERLGIVGGISILGTTGIVRPVSAEAWTATITAAMRVAQANSCKEIVLSTGRTSEKAIHNYLKCKPEALIMMGDYLEFALLEASKFEFRKLHLSGMWAKILKAAMEIPQTHVRFGALEVKQAVIFIQSLVPGNDLDYIKDANTAREIYERLASRDAGDVIYQVCLAAQKYQKRKSGLPVVVYLVHHTGEIVTMVDTDNG